MTSEWWCHAIGVVWLHLSANLGSTDRGPAKDAMLVSALNQNLVLAAAQSSSKPSRPTGAPASNLLRHASQLFLLLVALVAIIPVIHDPLHARLQVVHGACHTPLPHPQAEHGDAAPEEQVVREAQPEHDCGLQHVEHLEGEEQQDEEQEVGRHVGVFGEAVECGDEGHEHGRAIAVCGVARGDEVLVEFPVRG